MVEGGSDSGEYLVRAVCDHDGCSWDRPCVLVSLFFFFQAEDGIRDVAVTGVQTCALPISLNSSLKIIASPWSPPGWMKTSGSMIQGALLPSAYSPLAKYFVRFVEEYEIGRASCRERV